MSFSKVIIISILVTVGGFIYAHQSTKDKTEYTKAEGRIQHSGKKYKDLPNRNHGDYRYLMIDHYPYVFEIYEPNSIASEHHIDELEIGDRIEIYYYETSNTHQEQINRFARFIDKGGIPYFIADGFQKTLGYVLVGMGILLAIGALILKKKGLIKT